MRYKWKDKTAGENMGRANLDLFGKQLELVQAIEKTGTPSNHCFGKRKTNF